MLRTAVLFLAFSGVCLAQAPVPVDPAAKLIEEIETIASAEPPLLGIDTQTEAAKILLTARPATARRLLDSALSRTRTLLDPLTVRNLMFPAVDLLYKLDPDEAAQTVSTHLLTIQARKPSRDDGLLLSSFEPLFRHTHPSLAAACEAESERILKLHPPTHDGIDKPSAKWPKTDGLNTDEFIDLARQQKDPLVRVEMLISAIDDKDTPPRRGAALASEALASTDKLPISDGSRIVYQSMLTRRLHQAGDLPTAANAAQMLEQSFIKMYDCETAACTSFKGDDSPGELVRFFAQYLNENHIAPADIGLTHRSLSVRMMLIELPKILETRK
ncbi:MAG: hypothetical protein IH602_15750 [Bryobacteraceae bacterium]|nr:hypothetical protein [Bryobacteraceae bacterium]